MRLPSIALGLFLACRSHARANDIEERLRALEQRFESPRPAERASPALDVSFDERGFRFATPDNAFSLRLSGHVIVHGTKFIHLGERDSIDNFSVREAGFELDATLFHDWRLFIAPAHVSSTTQGIRNGFKLLYGWVEFSRFDFFRVRAGLFKVPIALETLEETIWWDYLENSIVYMHAPLPDIGAMVHGSVAGGFFRYSLGVFNGTGGDTGTDDNSDKDFAARVQFTPTALIESEVLQYLHVAASATHGNQERKAPATPFPFQDPATATVFHANPAATNFRTDRISRLNIEAATLVGPVEVKTEYSWFRSRVEFDGKEVGFRSNAWYVHAAVWIGGRRLPFGVPEVDKPLFGGGFGAVQVGARYAALRMEDDFRKRAGFVGARRAQEFSAIVNWFPNRNVRVSLEYVDVEYGHGRAVLKSGRFAKREDMVLVRLQVSF